MLVRLLKWGVCMTTSSLGDFGSKDVASSRRWWARGKYEVFIIVSVAVIVIALICRNDEMNLLGKRFFVFEVGIKPAEDTNVVRLSRCMWEKRVGIAAG